MESTEKQIENTILAYLNYQQNIVAMKINTLGVYDQRGGFYRRLSKYVLPGTPDIIACVSVETIPVFVGLEVKSKTGRQSDAQKHMERLLERIGGFYFVVRSLQDTRAALAKVHELIKIRINSNMSS